MRCALPMLTLVSFFALGCEGTVASATPSDAEATTTSAVVIVERTVEPSSGPHVQASARFVRIPAAAGHPSDVEGALRAIGAAVDLPAKGRCVPLGSPAADIVSEDEPPVVELVDVGSVSIESDRVETRLTARQVPDVTDIVSGIVYARAVDPNTFPPSARYVLHVGGQPQIAAFDLVATAPPDPNDVTFTGETTPAGSLVIGDTVEASWAPDGTTDAIFVDLQPADVRCTLGEGGADADAAHAALPASLLGAEGTLTVHRLRREAVSAPGLFGGELRFDFARSLAYARR
ncbi:MAG: hypothetical protein FWD17_14585 [Polyangiaceae bacterium]|nr:hypothetical protein [Polyangiaceae bacterium]